MLSPELLKQIQRINLRAGRVVTDLLVGEYTSVFKGRGIEFDEVRPYSPGDDVRSIDWNVTARTGAPHVKIFHEDREMTVLLLVDVSASQRFGSNTRSKLHAAAEFAAVIAYLASRGHDRVGLLLFADDIREFIPPGKGRGHIWNIIRAVLMQTSGPAKDQGRSDIAKALSYAQEAVRRRSLCFVISDFASRPFEKHLRPFAIRHEVVAVQTEDPWERDLSDVGVVELTDSEVPTAEAIAVDFSSSAFRSVYKAKWASDSARFLERMRLIGVDVVQLHTNRTLVEPLVQWIRRRELRFGKHAFR